jgi:hypothetical protein
MALQFGVLARNGLLNSINTSLGGDATLKLFTGAVPANCAAADPAGPFCTMNLPGTPFAPASAGSVTLAGTWSVAASGTGTAQSWRIYDSAGLCQAQGNVTTDLVLNNNSISTGQTITVTSFGLTSGNP